MSRARRPRSRLAIRCSLLAFGVAVVACSDDDADAAALAPRSPTPETRRGLRIETVARGLEHPWAIAVLPDGRLLVTERPGRLRIVERDGQLSAPLSGVPPVFARSQGGLLDVALEPNFERTQIIYLSYAERGDGGAGTSVARARLGNGALDDVRVIYRQQPKVPGDGHFGSRIVIARDGTLWITQGDRFEHRRRAQDLDSGIGKIMRIDSGGRAPSDNPFVARQGALREIWSYGHRNVQAAAMHPETGELWTVEHGAKGGDELNRPLAGRNYGWPVITYGRDYNGRRIGEGRARAGMEQPVYYWDPVIAPSGMTFYTGDLFPGWKGSILVGSLVTHSLVRLVMQNGQVTREERYDVDGERVRDVQQAADGSLYVVTDSPTGRLLRLRPASAP